MTGTTHKYTSGNLVSWRSQSNGRATKKTGKVIARVPPYVGVSAIASAHGILQFGHHNKVGENISQNARYLVAVDKIDGKKLGHTAFYSPMCSVVDAYGTKAAPKAKKAAKGKAGGAKKPNRKAPAKAKAPTAAKGKKGPISASYSKLAVPATTSKPGPAKSTPAATTKATAGKTASKAPAKKAA